MNFAEGKVAAFGIHKAVGREDVVQIGAWGGLVVQPALRPYMLAVVTITFLSVIAALIGAEIVIVFRGAARDVGVNVPNPLRVIGTWVGVWKYIPVVVVADDGVVLDNVMQGGFQVVAGFVVGGVVITVRGLCKGCEATDNQ